jgi:hypothetical protein
MNRQIHGILSLVLIAAAVITALAAIFPSSLFWALIYITGILASSLIIVYSFCAKCPCRHTSCGHVLPGALTWFFPRREEGPYTLADTVGVVVPLVFLVVFPQYWLFSHTVYFILFAAFWILAAADIQFFVCRDCANTCCPFFQGGCGKKQEKE